MDIFHKFLALVTASFVFVVARGKLLPIVNHSDDGSTTGMQTYIVHVQKPNGIELMGFRDRKDWYMSFLPNATLDSGEPRMLYAYRLVICGFAARLTRQEAKAMESMEGFLHAYPQKMYYGQTTYTPQYLGLSQIPDGLWDTSKFGNGVIIGVVDSGITPTHPSFQDSLQPPMPEKPTKFTGQCHLGHLTCNNKLIGAVGFRNGQQISALDDDGHGTHCASTAAGSFVQDSSVLGMASGAASGMAPRAHLAIYKVLTKDPATDVTTGADIDILAGIEQAIMDQVDVLSMSIGRTKVPLYESPEIIASFAAMKRGIVTVAAAGNNGPWPSEIANDAPWMLTVGASSVGRRISATVRLGNGRELDGESAYQPHNTPQLPLVYPVDRDCNSPMPNIMGRIVLCERIKIDSLSKGQNVRRAGGSAMIVLNGRNHGKTTEALPHVLPAAHVAFDAVGEIDSYITNTINPTAAIIFRGTQIGGPTPAVASFSSRGPSLMNGGILKPDIVAPGVNILAAWPFEVGPNPRQPFNFLSGTSMATPHVAGIVALLKKMHPSWSPAAIKSAIMTTAFDNDNTGTPMIDEYSGVAADIYAQGSGHVKPTAASDPGLVYNLNSNDYINYLCGARFTSWQVSTIASTPVGCARVQAIAPEQLNYPSITVNLGPRSQIKSVMRTLTNVDESRVAETYQVQVSEPTGVRVVVTPTRLQFQSLGQEKVFTVVLSFKGAIPNPGFMAVGRLSWVSTKHAVKVPIVVHSPQ